MFRFFAILPSFLNPTHKLIDYEYCKHKSVPTARIGCHDKIRNNEDFYKLCACSVNYDSFNIRIILDEIRVTKPCLLKSEEVKNLCNIAINRDPTIAPDIAKDMTKILLDNYDTTNIINRVFDEQSDIALKCVEQYIDNKN